MKYNLEQLRELARITAAAQSEEINCEDWLDKVAQYLDLMDAKEPIPEELRDVVMHAEVCCDCRLELQMMLEAVAHASDEPEEGESHD